jgi:hypothetical protein
MRDITAVVLSIGEPYTEHAIASLQRQTLPPADLVVVRGVSPFHRALNHGAAQVRTPFLVQVDADMVLDDTCLAELRSRMHDHIGLVSAQLRDPVLGRVHGIRLYRTQCFEHAQIRDTISPDLDFTTDIHAHGWGRVFTLRYHGARPEQWHTLGDHRPDYADPQYTFGKFLLEGVRSRYRRREGRVRLKFRQLCASTHEVASLALIAVSHGLFLDEQRDLLAPYRRTADFELLQTFLAAGGDGVVLDDGNGTLRDRFSRAYEQGVHCRRHGASATFLTRLDQLKRQPGVAAWMTLVGMCHGLFHRDGTGASADQAFASLAEILTYGPPW